MSITLELKNKICKTELTLSLYKKDLIDAYTKEMADKGIVKGTLVIVKKRYWRKKEVQGIFSHVMLTAGNEPYAKVNHIRCDGKPNKVRVESCCLSEVRRKFFYVKDKKLTK